jgi:hypothetical protein
MSQVFKGQTNLVLAVETGIDNLVDASVKQILAERPNGSKKAFNATVVAEQLRYQIQTGDIDRAGKWRFQAYALIGGKEYFGEIIERVFLRNLKSN